MGSHLHSRNKPHVFTVLLVVFAGMLRGASAVRFRDEVVYRILCRIIGAGSVAVLRSPDICRRSALGRGEGCVSI